MIQNFRHHGVEDIFNNENTKEARKLLPSNLWHTAQRKLDQLDSAGRLNDLRMPPGNRLGPLKGDREEQYSIRINDQYRICFYWNTNGPTEVEIVDYH